MAKRIIVPLDRSDVAERALPVARGLVKQLGLPVTLVSVVEGPPSLAAYVPGGDQPPARQINSSDVPQHPYGSWDGQTSNRPSDAEIQRTTTEAEAAEAYLNRIAETFENVPVEVTLRFGQPAERILQTAEDRPGSFIVIASHGRSGLPRAMIGSVASHVIRGATNPVFAIRATVQNRFARAPVMFNKALVALDTSAFSEQSLPVLQNIFGPDNLEIHLLNVITEPLTGPRRENESYLKWISEKLQTDNNEVTWETREGTPPEAINARAREHNVDLIVLTTHGYSGIRRFVLGSVTERVLQIADRPLLIVRPLE